jgi:hypothetical protein
MKTLTTTAAVLLLASGCVHPTYQTPNAEVIDQGDGHVVSLTDVEGRMVVTQDNATVCDADAQAAVGTCHLQPVTGLFDNVNVLVDGVVLWSGLVTQ